LNLCILDEVVHAEVIETPQETVKEVQLKTTVQTVETVEETPDSRGALTTQV